jgi:hypothetical protein
LDCRAKGNKKYIALLPQGNKIIDNLKILNIGEEPLRTKAAIFAINSNNNNIRFSNKY